MIYTYIFEYALLWPRCTLWCYSPMSPVAWMDDGNGNLWLLYYSCSSRLPFCIVLSLPSFAFRPTYNSFNCAPAILLAASDPLMRKIFIHEPREGWTILSWMASTYHVCVCVCMWLCANIMTKTVCSKLCQRGDINANDDAPDPDFLIFQKQRIAKCCMCPCMVPFQQQLLRDQNIICTHIHI